MTQTRYESLGVSSTKPDVRAAIVEQDKGLFPGAFCTIVEDEFTDDPNYCVVMHTDGAGTKTAAAYVHYKEYDDPTIWHNVAYDSLTMNLNDMGCVGADRFVAVNAIGRNAHRVGAAAIRHLIEGYAALSTKMSEYGIHIRLTGGETADEGDVVATLVADSAVTARMERNRVVDCSNITPGNHIVGFASFGQTAYEDTPNSGIGSNGLALARHTLLTKTYADKYPETYSGTVPYEEVYTGPYHLEDKLPGSNQTIGEAILSPTRIYLPLIKDILGVYGDSVTGIIHNTGGGMTKCLNFGNGLQFIKDSLFPAPPIFKAIQCAGNIPPKDMHQAFNMGHLLEIYCKPEASKAIAALGKPFGVDARLIGQVAASNRRYNSLILKSADGASCYYQQ